MKWVPKLGFPCSQDAKILGATEDVQRLEAELRDLEAKLNAKAAKRSRDVLDKINKRNMQVNQTNVLKGVGFR